MSDPEATAPPVPPKKWRRILPWLKSAWTWATIQIQAHPDRALVVFLVLLAVAVVF